MDNSGMNHPEINKPDSVLSFLNVLFKRGKLILIFLITVVSVVTISSFVMTPVYKAHSKLLVEREMDSEKALLFQMSLPSSYERYNWIQSEMDIINSHPVAEELVSVFMLDERDQSKSPATEAEKIKRREKAVERFKTQLVVDNTNESNVLDLSYEDEDPQLAKAIVAKVIATYLDHRSKITTKTGAYEFFEDQMSIADNNLRVLEQRQTEFKRKEGVISPEVQREILLARLADYEKSLTEVRTKRMAKAAVLAVIKDHLKNGMVSNIPNTDASDSPSRERHIAKLKGDLLDLELQRETLLLLFTPEFKEVKHLENQIKITKEKIVNEINEIISMEETSIKALRAEEKVLKSSIKSLKEEIQDFAGKEYELVQLSRGIDENKEVYSMFLRQREEARISLAKLERGVKVSIISPAFISPDPVRPRKALNIILSVLMGLMGGLVLAVFAEYFDDSVSSPAELEKLTGLDVLGSIREVSVQEPNGSKKVKIEA